jgi:hypothetical protein
MPSFNKEGIKVLSTGKRMFDRGFRLKVLEEIDACSDLDKVAAQFKITKRELGRIVAWKKQVAMAPERIAEVEKEKSLRERLYEKAASAAADSLEPLETFIKRSPFLSGEGIKHLPVAVNHLRSRGQSAVKIMEGLGDFRRGSEDSARDIPRVPLFNLPPGTQVDVSVNITRADKETDAISNGEVIECRAEFGEEGQTAEGEGENNKPREIGPGLTGD